MIVADEKLPPEAGQLNGLAFSGGTAKDAELDASAYLGCPDPAS